ncbi:MAG: hypothetical protein HC888_02530 [Candidatus Competibacteraceae bacterium]|nr:hypothetical protein [Candidatus Competibacteraceae bacterium]
MRASKKMYLIFNKNLVVTAVTDSEVIIGDQSIRYFDGKLNPKKLIGNRLPRELITMQDFDYREPKDLKIAFVCNWNDQCGISTYSKFLGYAISPKVKDFRVFSEHVRHQTAEDEGFVERCWKRGESLVELADRLTEWGPDLVVIQHEFGIFPNAFHFMQLMERIQHIPYVVTMHSVYQHLDKVVYTECIKRAVVHSQAAADCLVANGNSVNSYVIPHGCIAVKDHSELWNLARSPYTIMQFGFGFRYKGVDQAIHAVTHLVKNDPKFKDLYYIYLSSESPFNTSVHDEYYQYLRGLVKELGVERNVAIIRKYQSEQMLNLYMRLFKLAIFPYIVDPSNTVFGASGAIRIALANHRPVVASNSPMFADLDGIVPRPNGYLELAKEIDEIFSNQQYRDSIVERGKKYMADNSWDKTADRYIALYNQIVNEQMDG